MYILTWKQHCPKWRDSVRVFECECICESVRACMERYDNGFSVNINATTNLEGLLTVRNCSNCPYRFREKQNDSACRASFKIT